MNTLYDVYQEKRVPPSRTPEQARLAADATLTVIELGHSEIAPTPVVDVRRARDFVLEKERDIKARV